MISPIELLIGGAVVVLMFGTKKLPELGSGLGEAISNFHKAKASVLTPLDDAATAARIQTLNIEEEKVISEPKVVMD